jgi:hypothetical protein
VAVSVITDLLEVLTIMTVRPTGSPFLTFTTKVAGQWDRGQQVACFPSGSTDG